jgi:type IX secretion system PorP/SprF family membrane protein
MLLSLIAKGQDIHFSQFYENAIMRNPGLTGIFSGDYRVVADYRTQWGNISVPYTTSYFSGEMRRQINGVGDCISFGMAVIYDKAGSISFNSMEIYPAFNYNKAIEDKHNSYFSVGFAGGYIQRSVDASKMTFSTQYENGEFESYNPTGEDLSFKTIHDYDLSSGISFNSSAGPDNRINYYLGAAAYHLTKPKQTFLNSDVFSQLNTKWDASLGIKYIINYQIAVTAHLNYSLQHPYEETIFGGLVSWKNISPNTNYNFTIYAGMFTRLHDAMIPTMKFDYQSYSMTISYDINTSSLKPASNGNGGFEISLSYRGKIAIPEKMTDKFRCPRFEDLNETFSNE